MTKTTFTGKGRLGLLLCLTGLLAFSVPRARADAGDPPTRVARISYVDGSVSIQPGGTGDWGAAQQNRPMTVGDKLWADKDSRVELQTGVVTIHMGSMTALSFLNLDENITQMRLAEGSLNFRVKEIREGDLYEVDTPNLAFTVKEAGAFRIDVNENGDSTGITVIRGSGEVTASGKTYDLNPGERGVFNGTDNVQSTIAQAPPSDGLDQWANDRDLGEQNSVSQRYVPPDMPGTEDLDNNGTWNEQPDVGPVWYPNEVPPDWAPYSYGSWSYIGPWGWTWVDYAPWGFAPFHYGRWGFWGGRWGWCPGPMIGPAVYGPAFVGFLGGGFGFGFGAGFGVGWFPLGWGEPYHPWFHCGAGFAERINVRNTFIRNVGSIHSNNFNYAYAHNIHAVTAASRSAFTGGQAINRGAAHFTEASLRGAEVTNRVGFSPTRQSSLGVANMRGNISRPPMSVENRSVMARTAPASGASHLPVRTMNTRNLTAGRPGSFSANTASNRGPNNAANSRASNVRTWEAQGNGTDRGRAPQGFGSDRASTNSTMSARSNRSDRPPWAGTGSASNYGGARSGRNVNRPAYSGGARSYEPPQRSSSYGRNYSAPSRSYAPPSRSYSYPSRSYSAPSRSYSAPSRTYSAPSRSYGGGGGYHGGGASHGGGGGRPHR
jgi:hypothetical protein